MMGEKVHEANNDFEDWIAELTTDADGGAGNSRVEETRIQSSAFIPNIANRMTGNAAERFHHHTAAKSVAMPESSAVPKQVGSISGLTPTSTIEAAGHISFSHNRPLHSADSNDQSRRDIQPSCPANSSEAYSRVQTSKISVSRSRQQLQFPRQNINRPSIHLFTEPNDNPSHIKQQPYFKAAWSQPSQESTSANQTGNLGTALILQHRQQPGLQSSFSEMQQQLPQIQNDVSNELQRPSQQQNSAFTRLPTQQQRHQQMMATPSNYPNRQAHQHLSDDNRMSEALKSQYNLQQLSQPTQFLQNVNIQTSEGRQDNLQTSTFLHSQSSMVSNQMKQTEESHRVPPENSSGSAAPRMLTNSSDWRDQAYEQLQFVKEVHLADLMKVYKRAEELSLQSATAERTDKYEKTRLFVEKIVTFLQIPKANFFQYSQEEVHQKMRLIMWYIKQLKDRNPPPMQQYQSLQQSARQLEMRQIQQRGEEDLQANVSMQDMTSTLVPVPQFSTQRGTINSQAWPINSSLTGMKQVMQQVVTSKNDPRNSKFGQVMSHQRIPREQHLIGQSIEHSSHRWVPSSTSQHHVASSQVPQPRSPLVESIGISSTRASITSQPIVSPSPVPLNVSSALVNLETNHSSHPLSLIKGNITISKSFSPTTSVRSLNLDSHAAPRSSSLPTTTTPGNSEQSHAEGDSNALPKSSLPLMITCPGDSEQCHAEEYPNALAKSSLPRRTTLPSSGEQSHAEKESFAEIPGFNRLLEVVQSLSQEELHSSIEDIGIVVNLFDWTPRTSPYGGCREYTIDNSKYHWRYDEQEGVFFPHYGDTSDTKIKRHGSAMAPDGLTSPSPSPSPSFVRDDCSSGLTADMEFSPACTTKRQKTKLSDLLLQEVKEINQKLVETVLGMIHSPDVNKGIIVHFSYRAVGHNKNNLSTLPDLVLQVFVEDDYPCSSPYSLDPSPDMFRDNEEHKALWENTRSIFNISLRMCPQPISLAKMARTWDSSARDAIVKFARKQGGGCFTSTYGGWQDCAST